MENIIKVAITGATGNISYNAIFRLAAGEAFGEKQKISLHLYDLPGTEKTLEGIAMELEDCCTSVLAGVDYGSNLERIFTGVDYALLIGAKPRGPGMERAELLAQNGSIFVKQGQALNKVAKRDVKVIVVGNPCNTNCLVALHHAPDLKKQNFHAMLRLDQNRAVALLAKKANVQVCDVSNVVVWGNHSATQVPDASLAKIQNRLLNHYGIEPLWLQETFSERVQKRGAEVIQSLGRSSAASAAKAAIDSIKDLHFPTPAGSWFTSGVYTYNNPYGIEQDLVFGMPCVSQGNGLYSIVSALSWSSFIKQKIATTQTELIAEKQCCIKEGLLKQDRPLNS